MATTVYNPVRVTKKPSKIYHKVTATIKGLYLLHAVEHTVVFINKIEELSQKQKLYKNLRWLSKVSYNCQSILINNCSDNCSFYISHIHIVCMTYSNKYKLCM